MSQPTVNKKKQEGLDYYILSQKASNEFVSRNKARDEWSKLPRDTKLIYINQLLSANSATPRAKLLTAHDMAIVEQSEGRPVKPLTAYKAFCQDILVTSPELAKQKAVLNERWKSLDREAKSEYVKAAKTRRIEYKVLNEQYLNGVNTSDDEDDFEVGAAEPSNKENQILNKEADVAQTSRSPVQKRTTSDDVDDVKEASEASDDVAQTSRSSVQKRTTSDDVDGGKGASEASDDVAQTSRSSVQKRTTSDDVDGGNGASEASDAVAHTSRSSVQKRKHENNNNSAGSQSKMRKMAKEAISGSQSSGGESSGGESSGGESFSGSGSSSSGSGSSSSGNGSSGGRGSKLQFPPKNAFTYFALNYCDSNYHVAVDRWAGLTGAAKGVVVDQWCADSYKFASELQTIINHCKLVGKPLDHISQCPITFEEPKV